MSRYIIAIIDFVTLLTVAFLFVGNVIGAMAHSPAPPATRPQAPALQAAAPAVESGSEPELPHPPQPRAVARDDEVTARPAAARALRESVGKIDQEIEAARRRLEVARERLASAATREEELSEVNAQLGSRARDLEQLAAEKMRQQQRLADLQAGAVAFDKPGSKTGAPIVNRQRKPTQRHLLLLAQGRIFPLSKEYFSGRKVDGRTVVWVREGLDGLSIEDALKEESEALRPTRASGFRDDGLVVMLVNPDSFDAFRVLRDALTKQGIDWGWEPHDGRRIVFSDIGKSIYPHETRRTP